MTLLERLREESRIAERVSLRLIVVVAMWLLFAMSDHSDSAISVSLGGTVAITVLTISEPVWKALWRLLIEEPPNA